MPACASNLGAVCLGRPATAMWLMVTQEQQSWLSTAHLFQHALGSPVSGTGRPTQSAQSQRPNDRAADDVSRDCAHREDQKCHGVSLLGRWTDPQGCPAFRAPGQPRRPQAPIHQQGPVACGIAPQTLWLAAHRGQSPSARTTGRLMTQPVMQQAMMTSVMVPPYEKRGGTTAPCGSVTAPAGLRNLPGQTNAPTCGASLPVYSANPFWGRGCHPIR